MRKYLLYMLFCLMGIPSAAQRYFNAQEKLGRYVDEDGNKVVQPDKLIPLDTGQVHTHFAQLSGDAWVAFGYPQNGCQYRAHTMARILKAKGVASNKIWSFKPSLVGDNLSKGDLTINDPNFPGDKVVWAYHVATVIGRQLPNGQVDTVVIDPSMFRKAVPYREWLDSLHCPTQYFTFVNSKYVQYETSANNVLTGLWYSDKHAIDMRWIPTSLCKGKIFYRYIQQEIQPLRKALADLDGLMKNASSTKQRHAYQLEKRQLEKLYQERKAIASDSYRFGDLPREYQAMLVECQEHIMACMLVWWDYINTSPPDFCR